MPVPGSLIAEFTHALNDNILKKWYPLVVDKTYGGYFTNVTYDWKLMQEQEKMIVTQARHVWTLSKSATFQSDGAKYRDLALHGYSFLKNVMWDSEFGGFYQIRSREGGPSDVRGWRDEKRSYGNAFGVYALAAFYDITRDPEVLAFARRAFAWIEDHAYDPREKGYFEFLMRDGTPFNKSSDYVTVAADGNEVGYKDQNSSIHLLEAYTELYKVWKDPVLREKLLSLLILIRDTMVAEKGYLQLFFYDDWTPLSFRDAPAAEREANFGLDHVSFGHDFETAFLMLEASHALGLEDDKKTLAIGRKMVDHGLAHGWDKEVGGVYDGGYYLKDRPGCTILRDTKNWWAQAETLNALLLLSKIYPDAGYEAYFLRQWEYVKEYILDKRNGDWFEGGIDKEPDFTTGLKSHIWKCTYHTGRSLMNCIAMLSDGSHADAGIVRHKREIDELIAVWKKVAASH